MNEPLLNYFPLETPRQSQILVLNEIEKAYSSGYKFVILEAPVGSGKSAIAMSVAKWFGNAHILTPRKSLQDQYFEDFKEDIVLMKGRSSYFCTYTDTSGEFQRKVINWITNGSCPQPTREFTTCAEAPCKDNQKVFLDCTELRNRVCPYKLAIEVAEKNGIIVHNFHSFIYQYHYAERFDERKVMIIDEAHEVENILRNFDSIKFSISRIFTEESKPNLSETKLQYWSEFFSNENLWPRGQKSREEFIERLNTFKQYAYSHTGDFVAKQYENSLAKITTFEFTPVYVGNQAQSLLFSCAEKVLLMSGTIYNKEVYCSSLGINPESAYFIRIGSSFPTVSRPIYMKKEYLIDTSYAKWNENKEQLTSILQNILEKFKDVKGLIHVPSYSAGNEIKDWLKNPRLKTHTSENFVHELDRFYKSKKADVFVSPTCQQGVDFKDERARFQIIVRVPYLNTSDRFVEYQVKNNFPWYNHQALILFGQQIGRINRNEEDFGVTVLIDERFVKFINRNKKSLPKWLLDSIRT